MPFQITNLYSISEQQRLTPQLQSIATEDQHLENETRVMTPDKTMTFGSIYNENTEETEKVEYEQKIIEKKTVATKKPPSSFKNQAKSPQKQMLIMSNLHTIHSPSKIVPASTKNSEAHLSALPISNAPRPMKRPIRYNLRRRSNDSIKKTSRLLEKQGSNKSLNKHPSQKSLTD